MRTFMLALATAVVGLAASSPAQAQLRILPSYHPRNIPTNPIPYRTNIQMPIIVPSPYAARPAMRPEGIPHHPGYAYPGMTMPGRPGQSPNILNAYGNALTGLSNAGPVGAMVAAPLTLAAPLVAIGGIMESIFGR
jgi:hypothetical protein